MSKKYVPSFLQQGELPTNGTAGATAPLDAFFTIKKQKENHATFDAFPMNKRGPTVVKGDHVFDAFSKVKKLPEVDAFSPFHATRKFVTAGSHEGASDAFSAFCSKTRGAGTNAGAEGGHDFPMSKRSDEDRPPRGETSRGVRNPHLVLEPMTYGGALLVVPVASAKKAAAVVIVSGKQPSTTEPVDDANDSFASKFATKMKMVEDPSYVPPPTVVDMESEQDFPTLGVITTKTTQGWAQPLRSDECTQPVVTIQKKSEDTTRKRLPKKTSRLEGAVQAKPKMIPVVPHRMTKKQEEGKEDGEFKPIEYDEDAFDEDEELDPSDLDEDALFADEDDSNEEDEMDPSIYENRRPEDLY